MSEKEIKLGQEEKKKIDQFTLEAIILSAPNITPEKRKAIVEAMAPKFKPLTQYLSELGEYGYEGAFEELIDLIEDESEKANIKKFLQEKDQAFEKYADPNNLDETNQYLENLSVEIDTITEEFEKNGWSALMEIIVPEADIVSVFGQQDQLDPNKPTEFAEMTYKILLEVDFMKNRLNQAFKVFEDRALYAKIINPEGEILASMDTTIEKINKVAGTIQAIAEEEIEDEDKFERIKEAYDQALEEFNTNFGEVPMKGLTSSNLLPGKRKKRAAELALKNAREAYNKHAFSRNHTLLIDGADYSDMYINNDEDKRIINEEIKVADLENIKRDMTEWKKLLEKTSLNVQFKDIRFNRRIDQYNGKYIEYLNKISTAPTKCFNDAGFGKEEITLLGDLYQGTKVLKHLCENEAYFEKLQDYINIAENSLKTDFSKVKMQGIPNDFDHTKINSFTRMNGEDAYNEIMDTFGDSELEALHKNYRSNQRKLDKYINEFTALNDINFGLDQAGINGKEVQGAYLSSFNVFKWNDLENSIATHVVAAQDALTTESAKNLVLLFAIQAKEAVPTINLGAREIEKVDDKGFIISEILEEELTKLATTEVDALPQYDTLKSEIVKHTYMKPQNFKNMEKFYKYVNTQKEDGYEKHQKELTQKITGEDGINQQWDFRFLPKKGNEVVTNHRKKTQTIHLANLLTLHQIFSELDNDNVIGEIDAAETEASNRVIEGIYKDCFEIHFKLDEKNQDKKPYLIAEELADYHITIDLFRDLVDDLKHANDRVISPEKSRRGFQIARYLFHRDANNPDFFNEGVLPKRSDFSDDNRGEHDYQKAYEKAVKEAKYPKDYKYEVIKNQLEQGGEDPRLLNLSQDEMKKLFKFLWDHPYIDYTKCSIENLETQVLLQTIEDENTIKFHIADSQNSNKLNKAWEAVLYGKDASLSKIPREPLYGPLQVLSTEVGVKLANAEKEIAALKTAFQMYTKKGEALTTDKTEKILYLMLIGNDLDNRENPFEWDKTIKAVDYQKVKLEDYRDASNIFSRMTSKIPTLLEVYEDEKTPDLKDIKLDDLYKEVYTRSRKFSQENSDETKNGNELKLKNSLAKWDAQRQKMLANRSLTTKYKELFAVSDEAILTVPMMYYMLRLMEAEKDQTMIQEIERSILNGEFDIINPDYAVKPNPDFSGNKVKKDALKEKIHYYSNYLFMEAIIEKMLIQYFQNETNSEHYKANFSVVDLANVPLEHKFKIIRGQYYREKHATGEGELVDNIGDHNLISGFFQIYEQLDGKANDIKKFIFNEIQGPQQNTRRSTI